MNANPPSTQATQRDFEKYIRVALALLAAHLVVINGTSYNFFHLLTDLSYYLEMLFSFLLALLMVIWISRVSVRLDNRFPWEQHVAKRLILQALFGIFIPILFEFVFVEAFFWFFSKKHLVGTAFFYNEFRMVVLMICFFNLCCACRYFYQQWRATAEEFARFREMAINNTSTLGIESGMQQMIPEHSDEVQDRDVFLVHTALRSIPIRIDNIAYFFRERGTVFLRTFSAEDYIISHSLDHIEHQLRPGLFFRAARHMLISQMSVVDYRPLTFGKTGLTLEPPFREPVNISKLAARSFRDWLNQ